MEIATGYFAKARQYSNMGYTLVSIAKVAPWFLPKHLALLALPELAPTDEILALKENPTAYAEKYGKEILGKARPDLIYMKLWGMCAGGSGRFSTITYDWKVVLLCYESPGKFCHRHLVAKWLGNFLERDIREITIVPKTEWSLFDSDV